ncbi:hypothetical protein F5Y17DRAFT_418000 [Xylariaceae sp. FL0594]|nr:hypothetical protein F5Y17DRAFT_418000 [Xylariaceae sp. FL0594]
MPKPQKGLAASRWAPTPLTSWPRPPPPSSRGSHTRTRSASPRRFEGHAEASGSTQAQGGHSTTASTVPPSNEPPTSPEQELSRFLKIVARLKWKIPFLEAGYGMALDRVGKAQEDIEANEIHFKLDFHEFYMLIERALVHLMGVFGIVIYAHPGPHGTGYGMRSEVDQETERAFRDRSQRHKYHEHVLLALDDEANPLHETLGRQDVRIQLGRAKELRNRWKNADDGQPGRFQPAPLEAYNLEEILQTILQALEQAYFVTEQYVRDKNPDINRNDPVSTADWVTSSADWDFMEDAMDWEAI